MKESINTILISGATGFLGSHLADALISRGYSVVILKRSTSNLWRIDHLMSSLKSYDVDLVKIESVFVENKIDCVIHTACSYGRQGESIEQIINTNVVFGLQILDQALKHNVKVFINADTLLGKNLSRYALSKSQFVDWLKNYSENLKVVNLKIEHMYGPKDDAKKLVPWVISKFEEQSPYIELTAGEQKRDFIYIDDVISAFILLIQKISILSQFNEFEVGTGKSVKVKKFLNALKKVYKAEINHMESELVFGAVPYRDGEVMEIKVNNSDLINLGWKPSVSMEKGLLNIIREFL
ncbi:NAD-dependent epimerase/dehydratase family protein [Pseudomonadales bacterium]|nr:NAD-dependent epimerase/dehydratase family protein [Pseudomonadales bacterium]